MAKIISDTLGKEVEVEDGTEMRVVEEHFEVHFGCEDGFCGTCKIEVLEGMANLTEKTENEIDFGLEDEERFSCQCKIKNGTVKIKHF